MRIEFKEVPIGASFISNGNVCVKLSSRTAVLVQYMKTFYFSNKDMVEVSHD